jgi:acyl dehydratase
MRRVYGAPVNDREPRPIGPGLVGLVVGPVRQEWAERDAILYALGIGARHPRDLELLYEGATPDGPRVAPTFALTAVTLMLPPLVEALGIDLRALLHASQGIELHRVPPARGACTVTRRVTSVWDKGRAAMVDCEDVVADDAGPLATARSSWWVEGEGGFGGPRSAPGAPAPVTRPEREPDERIVVSTTTEQAALHRLSGDLNPVHIDPAFAREAGQPRAFLHGLCTFGHLALELDRLARPSRRLASLDGRFTGVVFPGDDLAMEVWWTPGDDGAIAQVAADGRPALGPVTARFR